MVAVKVVEVLIVNVVEKTLFAEFAYDTCPVIRRVISEYSSKL